MPAKKKLLKYQEIATRVGGLQPWGMQWVPAEPDRKIVRDILTALDLRASGQVPVVGVLRRGRDRREASQPRVW